jgi:hypothetical protein
MIIPPAVFSSAGAGFTITRSAKGVTFNFLPIVVSIFVLMKEFSCQDAGSQSYTNFIPNPSHLPYLQFIKGEELSPCPVRVNFSAGDRLFGSIGYNSL